MKMTLFVFIYVSESILPHDTINKLAGVIILLSNHNNLKYPIPCKTSFSDIKMKMMDPSFNKIVRLENKHFNCLPEPDYINIKHNEVSLIGESTFKTLHKLKSLILKNNKLTSFGKDTIFGQVNMTLLNILQNSLIHVDKRLFNGLRVKIILTDDFHSCCLNLGPMFICNARPLWPSSCKALLLNVGLKRVSWLMGIIIVSLNILSICKTSTQWYKSHEVNDYDKYVMLVNNCDLVAVLYLLTLAVKDVTDGDNYVESDILWRSSITCHVLSFVSLVSIMSEALFMMNISIARYRVIKDPFVKPFGKKYNKL